WITCAYENRTGTYLHDQLKHHVGHRDPAEPSLSTTRSPFYLVCECDRANMTNCQVSTLGRVCVTDESSPPVQRIVRLAL
ncbi:hypothetical protein COCVIDRAFT_112423, partial [Bipolaris victoriae FI3]